MRNLWKEAPHIMDNQFISQTTFCIIEVYIYIPTDNSSDPTLRTSQYVYNYCTASTFFFQSDPTAGKYYNVVFVTILVYKEPIFCPTTTTMEMTASLSCSFYSNFPIGMFQTCTFRCFVPEDPAL